MKSFQFLSFLILINLFNLYFCLTNLALTATKMDDHLDINCGFNLDKQENFTLMEMSKDGITFFKYNNTIKTNKTVINNLKGLADVKLTHQQIDQSIVSLTVTVRNGNVSTNGNYICTVNNKTKPDVSLNIKLSSYSKTTIKANLNVVRKDKDIAVNCSTLPKFNKDQKVISIVISKDKKSILSLKDGKLDPVKGDFRNGTFNITDPNLSFVLNNTDKNHGTYLCHISFKNGSDSVNTLILQSVYNGAYSYTTDKLIVFLSTFLLIFVSFK